MRILQVGVPKSGNFWLYRILQSIIREADWPRGSYIASHPIQEQARYWLQAYDDENLVDKIDFDSSGCYTRIGFKFREEVENLDRYLSQCSHVWSHSPACSRTADLLSRFDRVFYLIRDPRDVAISLSRFVFTPEAVEHSPPHYEESPGSFLAGALEEVTRDWVEHVIGYLQLRRSSAIHVVFYERLVEDFESELRSILQFLGLEFSSEVLKKISAEVSFERLKKGSPNHLRTGRAGQWIRVLTAAQQTTVLRVAGPTLNLLGYPQETANQLPRVGNPAGPELEWARRSARRTPLDQLRRLVRFLLSKKPLKAKWALLLQFLRRKLNLRGAWRLNHWR